MNFHSQYPSQHNHSGDLIYNGQRYCHVGNPCGNPSCQQCKPMPSKGCAQIGTNCVFYGKDAGQVSMLKCLQIPNGASLTYIVEAIDAAFCNTIKPNYSIFNYSCFEGYEVKTQQQFVEVITLEVCKLKAASFKLGDNYQTEEIVKIRFTPLQIEGDCNNYQIPHTDIDIALLLTTIRDNEYLKGLFCSICSCTPTPQPVPIPLPIWIPTPVFVPNPIPLPIVVPVPTVLPLPIVVPVPTNSCVKVENITYKINNQTNINNFNFTQGVEDIAIAIIGYQPSTYSTPATYEFVLDFVSTGIVNQGQHTFPQVSIGNHILDIYVYNCGQTFKKTISFSLTALPTPIPVPVQVPVPTSQAWALSLCETSGIVNKQVLASGLLSVGKVIKEISTGQCYYLVSLGAVVSPLITDYTIITGDCDACLPNPICNWEDDTFFCNGVDRMVNQIDNCGHTRTVLSQANSKHCGYFSGHIELLNLPNNSENNRFQCPLGCNVCVRFVADTDYVPYTLNVTWSAANISGQALQGGPTIHDPNPNSASFCMNRNPPAQKEVRWIGPNCFNCSNTIRITADVVVNGYTFQFTKDVYSQMFQ